MALILSIETSTPVCSVALSKNGELLLFKEIWEGLSHASHLTVLIEELFKEIRDYTIKDLDAVAVSIGPGSYTGLRIGISAAKGLCYALDIKLIAISSLEILASNIIVNHKTLIGDDTWLCPMIDARRMEVYTALYNSFGEQVKPVIAQIIDEHSFANELKNHKILFSGNGAAKCEKHITSPNALFNGPFKTSARFMLFLSERKYNKKEFEDVAYFEPFYLKDFVATVPKNKVLK